MLRVPRMLHVLRVLRVLRILRPHQYRVLRRAVDASALLLLLITAAPPVPAQQGATSGEWRHYGGDLGSTKYSPLDQIDAQNFARLRVAWSWESIDGWLSLAVAGGEWWAPAREIFAELERRDPGRWRGGMEPRLRSLKVTPIMIGGVLYVATPLYQAAAVDAATGETLWRFNPRSYEAGTPTMSLLFNHRGVAYWSDGDEEERIFWGTGDGWLLAVGARTGHPVEEFGDGGRVDLMAGIPRAERGERDYLNALLYSCSSPPLVVGDVIVTGSSIADRRITKEAPPGDVRAWDVRTGELRWTFHTIPRPGEVGIETWEDGSWEYSGNANVWTMMSADPELGLVYLPTGTATNDFYGGHRLGANLFAESLVAIEAATGRRVWHFQMVHHGLWDYDNPAAPNLVDIEVDGRPVKAVAQVTKQGFTFVFDRATGDPIWPIEERAVPPSDIPGERAAPTQPFPTRPPPFEAQGVSEEDVIDFTPELKAEALEILRGFRIGPLFTPPSLQVEGGTQGTIQRPGLGGGANWSGAAVDPETGILYVPSRAGYTVVSFYTPDPEKGGTLRYTHRSSGGSRGPRGLPLFKPPYSRLTAIDLNRGEIAWTSPTGDGDEVRRHEALAHLDLPPLGGDGTAGPLLTRTLLITGEAPRSGAAKLVARDKASGRVLAKIDLPGRPIGTPMTYLVKGRQYVALSVAGDPPRIVALALP